MIGNHNLSAIYVLEEKKTLFYLKLGETWLGETWLGELLPHLLIWSQIISFAPKSA